ncbi:hypothetical protein Tco_1343245 [Tanacetum coccineum]
MTGKPRKLHKTDKPKLLENPNPAFNSKQHHVQSNLSPGSSVHGHRCGSEGVFQTPHLLRATEKTVSADFPGEFNESAFRCQLPLEAIWIPSRLPSSGLCGLKRKSQTGNTSDVFDRYSQLCAINVLSRFSSNSRHLPNNNGKSVSQHSDMCVSTQLASFGAASVVDQNSNREWADISKIGKSLGKEIVLDFSESTIRLGPTERQLEKAFLKRRYIRDDLCGSLFQQLESVETQGQSSRAVAQSLNETSEKFYLQRQTQHLSRLQLDYRLSDTGVVSASLNLHLVFQDITSLSHCRRINNSDEKAKINVASGVITVLARLDLAWLKMFLKFYLTG